LLFLRSQLAHYASATTDIEFQFPFGWGELWGIANRGDYDLRQVGSSCDSIGPSALFIIARLLQHATASGKSFHYTDPTKPTGGENSFRLRSSMSLFLFFRLM
jgi:hypothetical protein